jgi:hypothetical protein
MFLAVAVPAGLLGCIERCHGRETRCAPELQKAIVYFVGGGKKDVRIEENAK